MTALGPIEAAAFLAREALLLDRLDFDPWLALYTSDCLFWMPAWRDDGTQTEDPDRELSLIFYRGRRNLEDRVWRISSGQSVASTPLPRSVHAVTNVLVERSSGEAADVCASFAVHLFDVRAERTHVFFGRYEYRLVRSGEDWRIATKKVLLLNDVIPTVVDIYLV